MNNDEPEKKFFVVVNHEEQYSIWPEEKEPPNGWQRIGTADTKDKCLEYINNVWTDMRPLSLRRRMGSFD